MEIEYRLYSELKKLEDKLSIIAASVKEVMTLDEAAIYLGVSKSHLYKLTSSKKIPHYKPSNKLIFFKRVELEAWALSNQIS